MDQMLPNISTNIHSRTRSHSPSLFHSFYLFACFVRSFVGSIRTHSQFYQLDCSFLWAGCSFAALLRSRLFTCSLNQNNQRKNENGKRAISTAVRLSAARIRVCVRDCRWINIPSPQCGCAVRCADREMVCASIVSVSLPSMIISCVRANLVLFVVCLFTTWFEFFFFDFGDACKS